VATDTLKIIIDQRSKGDGAAKAKTGLDGLKKAAAFAMTAFVALKGAQGAVDFVRFGANVGRQAGALDNLARSAGTSGAAIVAAMQGASDFTIDRMTAMEAANKAMLLGVAQSPEEFARLAKVAVTLGRAMGQDAAKSIDDFVVAAGRQSKMIADNLGLMVGAEDANKRYAEKLGITAGALTDTQKKQAFLNEMLRQGEIKMLALGDATGDTATKVEQVDAALKDLKTSAAESTAEILGETGALEWLTTRLRGLPATVEQLSIMNSAANATMSEMVIQFFKLGSPIEKAKNVLGAFTGTVKEAVGGEEEWREAARYMHMTELPALESAVGDVGQGVSQYSDELQALIGTSDASRQAMVAYRGELDAQRLATEAATLAQMSMAERLADASQAQIAQTAIAQLKQALDAGTITFDQYRIAVTNTQLEFGLATPKSMALTNGIGGLTSALGDGTLKAGAFSGALGTMIAQSDRAARAAAGLKARLDGIPRNVTIHINTIESITRRETGQPMQAGGWAQGGLTLVGEKGPELVTLPRGAYVHNAQETRRMKAGGGVVQNFYINAAGMDVRELANELERRQRLTGARRAVAF